MMHTSDLLMPTVIESWEMFSAGLLRGGEQSS
jgi:hypothetical protein